MRVLTVEGGYADVSLAASGFLDGTDDGTLVRTGSVEYIPLADGTPVIRDYDAIYRTNPWLFATVRMLANGVARMPLKVYRYTDDEGNRERIRPQTTGTGDAARARAVSLARALRSPGHGISSQSLWRSTMTNNKVRGVAVWVIERDRFGNYVGFKRIPVRHLQRDSIAGVVRYWDSRTPSQKHLADDVIHFGLGSDCTDWDAQSPIDALHATLSLYDAVERHLVAFFKNSARPSGHYKVQPGTGRTARTAIRTAIQQLYAGPDNAGRVLVTSAEWQQHGQPDNTNVVALAKQSREEIVAVYNMPPPLVGILDRAIMSNVRELRSHYARDVVGPDCVLFEGDFAAQLIAQDDLLAEDVFVEFELAAVMRPDLEARAATFKDRRLVETLNEIRASEGKPRIDHPDADMPWMPLNEKPLGDDDDKADDPPLMDRSEGDDDA